MDYFLYCLLFLENKVRWDQESYFSQLQNYLTLNVSHRYSIPNQQWHIYLKRHKGRFELDLHSAIHSDHPVDFQSSEKCKKNMPPSTVPKSQIPNSWWAFQICSDSKLSTQFKCQQPSTIACSAIKFSIPYNNNNRDGALVDHSTAEWVTYTSNMGKKNQYC